MLHSTHKPSQDTEGWGGVGWGDGELEEEKGQKGTFRRGQREEEEGRG